MMASDKAFYPDGTNMSYFDVYDKEVTLKCPSCNEDGVQNVVVDGDHCTLNAECDHCSFTWEEEWWEEPDYDMSDIDYYDKF